MHTIDTTNMKLDTGYDFGTANHFFYVFLLPFDLNNHFNCFSLYIRESYHFRLNVRIVEKFFFFLFPLFSSFLSSYIPFRRSCFWFLLSISFQLFSMWYFYIVNNKFFSFRIFILILGGPCLSATALNMSQLENATRSDSLLRDEKKIIFKNIIMKQNFLTFLQCSVPFYSIHLIFLVSWCCFCCVVFHRIRGFFENFFSTFP